MLGLGRTGVKRALEVWREKEEVGLGRVSGWRFDDAQGNGGRGRNKCFQEMVEATLQIKGKR